MRKQKLLHQLSHSFQSVMWYTVETCWSDLPHTLISSIPYFKGENRTNGILFLKKANKKTKQKKTTEHWLVFKHLETDIFHVWYDEEATKLYILHQFG